MTLINTQHWSVSDWRKHFAKQENERLRYEAQQNLITFREKKENVAQIASPWNTQGEITSQFKF
jgi:hypothetical protein